MPSTLGAVAGAPHPHPNPNPNLACSKSHPNLTLTLTLTLISGGAHLAHDDGWVARVGPDDEAALTVLDQLDELLAPQRVARVVDVVPGEGEGEGEGSG